MKLEKWNPSVKAITVMVSAVLLAIVYLVSLNVIVFATCMILLLFFSDAKKKSIAVILIPAFLAALSMFMMGLYYAKGNSVSVSELENLSSVPYTVRVTMSQNFYTALQLSTRLLAFAGLGIMFALTTSGEYFVSSMIHQCHLSPKFAYGIIAAFNIMPGMVREYKKVRIAFEARGVKTHALSVKPMFTMLVNSVRWSESIAMAMESKGFCGNSKRSYYNIPRVTIRDILLTVCIIGEIVAGMIFLKY